MIHLDSYEWEGETFIRTWDTEVPQSLESLPRVQSRQIIERSLEPGKWERWEITWLALWVVLSFAAGSYAARLW